MARNTLRRLAAWMGALVLSILLGGCAGSDGSRAFGVDIAGLLRVTR